jgi:hypothetical protein
MQRFRRTLWRITDLTTPRRDDHSIGRPPGLLGCPFQSPGPPGPRSGNPRAWGHGSGSSVSYDSFSSNGNRLQGSGFASARKTLSFRETHASPLAPLRRGLFLSTHWEPSPAFRICLSAGGQESLPRVEPESPVCSEAGLSRLVVFASCLSPTTALTSANGFVLISDGPFPPGRALFGQVLP